MSIEDKHEDSPWQKGYPESHCYQYDIRIKNYEKDFPELNISEEEVKLIKISDFEFSYVAPENKSKCAEIKRFIERHEWLGKMPTRPTHRFIATFQGRLAGVIVMATPNSFSNLLGKENRHLEKLISRGACISWSPKNLASALIMFSIRWMVKNTSFRFFTAYSDTEAWELGTIYQACNFIYLGQTSGAKREYFDPENPSKGPFSDRQFRKTSQVKRYAQYLDVKWEKSWSTRDKLLWENIPPGVASMLKTAATVHQQNCLKRSLSPKHKYVYILGTDRPTIFDKLSNLKNLNWSAYPIQRSEGRRKNILMQAPTRPPKSSIKRRTF